MEPTLFMTTPNKSRPQYYDGLSSPRTNGSTLCSSDHMGEIGANFVCTASPFSNKTFQIDEDSYSKERSSKTNDLECLLSAEEEISLIFKRRYTPKKAAVGVLSYSATSSTRHFEENDCLAAVGSHPMFSRFLDPERVLVQRPSNPMILNFKSAHDPEE